MPSRPLSRVDEITREIAIGGLAGVITGVMVAGIGGRLFMRLAALVDPSAVGLLTSNGNRIGEVTVAGTVAFVVFVGPVFGAAAGVLWVIVSPWLPGRGAVRAAVTGGLAAAITPFFVVKAAETDFQLVQPVALVVGLLVGLAAIAGAVVAALDEGLRRRLPSAPSKAMLIAYRILTMIGLVFVPLVIGGYFLTEIPSYRPPAEVGIALLVVGGATAAWWIIRVRLGPDRPPMPLTLAARGALVGAVVLGTLKVWSELSGILERAAAH